MAKQSNLEITRTIFLPKERPVTAQFTSSFWFIKCLKMDSDNFKNIIIENGPVKGLKAKSVQNFDYFSFRGIPYVRIREKILE